MGNPDAGLSDEELLRRAATGDQPAFTDLVRRHEDRVFGIAVRMTGDRADALDATQDAFVSVFRQAGSFRGDAAFTTWLYRVAVNATRDLLRKRRRLPEPVEELPERDVPGTSPEETVNLRLDLAQALATLPDEYREAVLLHDVGALPYEEIAKITGAALGTVKSRISRGRHRLALVMQGMEGPPRRDSRLMEGPPRRDSRVMEGPPRRDSRPGEQPARAETSKEDDG